MWNKFENVQCIVYMLLNGTGQYLMEKGEKVDFSVGAILVFVFMFDGKDYMYIGQDDFLYTEWL